MSLPAFDRLYEFLRDNYLNSRFEGRNSEWPKSQRLYSHILVDGYMEDLEARGHALISHFESRTGKVIEFDASLTVTNPDAPPVEIQRKAGKLGGDLFGGGW